MKYVLFVVVLIAYAAVGYAIGTGGGSFLKERRDPFSAKREKYLDEDPDIQSNMHGEE